MEGYTVDYDQEHRLYRRSHDRGRPRDWPNVELRIPESLIADEAKTYTTSEEWLEEIATLATHKSSPIAPAQHYVVPFQRLQGTYRRAITTEKNWRVGCEPWLVKFSSSELRFELFSPLTLVVKVGNHPLLHFTPYRQHDNHPSNDD